MTAEEIDRTPAGPELDSLVAFEVMGLSIFVEDYGDHKETFQKLTSGRFILLPAYSIDIAAAWEVVAKHPHYFSLYRSNDSRNNPAGWWGPMLWSCRFYAPAKFEAHAETAPLVICRAALKAAIVAKG